MIKIYNRKTGEYDVEKVAGGGLMKALYGSGAGKVGLEVLVKRKLYSDLTGVLCNLRVSARKIKDFAQSYDIDISIAQSSLSEFKSFNDFFTRKLKPGARVFDREVSRLLCPGDGRVRAWENIHKDALVQVKGITYTLGELLADDELAKRYHGGVCILLRLAPVDYHRFHFIDNGIVGDSKRIKGHYYSVNPVALSTVPGVFCLNKREYSIQESEHFGDILYMEVGATSVGSIVQTYKPGSMAARGDEKGYFKFGGSTIILFLEKNKAKIDKDILEQTELGYEVRVLAGEVIGKQIEKQV